MDLRAQVFCAEAFSGFERFGGRIGWGRRSATTLDAPDVRAAGAPSARIPRRDHLPRQIDGLRPKYPEISTKPFWGTHETILKQSGRTPLPNDAAAKVAREAQMNHSIHSADRTTHLKIVVVALVAGIAVAAIGISARTSADTQTAHVVKAGKPMTVTSSNASLVR